MKTKTKKAICADKSVQSMGAKATKPKVITVALGEKYKPRGGPDGVSFAEPCEIKTGGLWYCTSHKKQFENQLQKDFHIGEPGTHKLGWLCREHGPEVP